MTIPNPSLDNLSFGEIFDKIRKRIPAYNQVWTDFNYSDPGITFLDLFSWLAENKIYSLNFIPKRNYLKFLKLLGFAPRPPSPLQIAVKLEKIEEDFVVKKDDVLVSESDPGLRFLVDKDIDLLRPKSSAVLLILPTGRCKLLNLKSDESVERSDSAIENHGMRIGLSIDDADLQNAENKDVSFLVLLNHYLEEKYHLGKHCSDPFLGTNEFVVWEYLKIEDDENNVPQEKWKKFEGNFEDGTNGLSKSGIVSFKTPFKTKDKLPLSHFTKNQEQKEYFWIQCSLKDAKPENDLPVILNGISLNCISATQGTKATEKFSSYLHNDKNAICEKLGTKSLTVPGLPNQHFQLNHNPIFGVESVYVIPEKEHLEFYQTEQSLQPWEAVDNFDHSTSTDRHFTLDYATGTISFGDGKNGMAPEMYSKILITYTYGEPKSFLAQTPILHSKDTLIDYDATPKTVLSEGRRHEELEDLVSRAREEIKIPHTAVTHENIKYIAKDTPNLRIARAEVIVAKTPNEINVVIIPVSQMKKPIPTRKMLDVVCCHLDKHRLLTTKIRVLEPKYVEISVRAKIKTSSNLSPDSIIKALDDFLTPVSQRPDYEGWQMGRPIYYSEVISIIEKVPGVDCIESMSISASGDQNLYTTERYPNIVIDKLAFVTPGNHDITISHITLRCQKSDPKSKTEPIPEPDEPYCKGRTNN